MGSADDALEWASLAGSVRLLASTQRRDLAARLNIMRNKQCACSSVSTMQRHHCPLFTAAMRLFHALGRMSGQAQQVVLKASELLTELLAEG